MYNMKNDNTKSQIDQKKEEDCSQFMTIQKTYKKTKIN